jgi:hypothetical protein
MMVNQLQYCSNEWDGKVLTYQVLERMKADVNVVYFKPLQQHTQGMIKENLRKKESNNWLKITHFLFKTDTKYFWKQVRHITAELSVGGNRHYQLILI